jgi:FtsZ-binding cell division protein ZapB
MNAAEVIEQVKADLRTVADQIDALQNDMVSLKAKKKQLTADRDDLQAFLDFKAAQT